MKRGTYSYASDVTRRALRMRARLNPGLPPGEKLPLHIADKCVRFCDAADRLDGLDALSDINRRLAARRAGLNPDAEPVYDELHPKSRQWRGRP